MAVLSSRRPFYQAKKVQSSGRTPPIEQSDSLSLLSLGFERLLVGRQAVLANPKLLVARANVRQHSKF